MIDVKEVLTLAASAQGDFEVIDVGAPLVSAIAGVTLSLSRSYRRISARQKQPFALASGVTESPKLTSFSRWNPAQSAVV